jgi:hypothetical protein
MQAQHSRAVFILITRGFTTIREQFINHMKTKYININSSGLIRFLMQNGNEMTTSIDYDGFYGVKK